MVHFYISLVFASQFRWVTEFGQSQVALRSFLDGEFGDETLEISADGERKNVPWRYPLVMTNSLLLKMAHLIVD